MIDHILTKHISPHLIHRSGQLLHGQGFDSDHRAMFADIDAKTMLSLTPQEPETLDPRRLVSGNVTNRDAYIKELYKQLEAHNVHCRVGTLATQAQTGFLTPAQRTEYNKLDDTITKAMLHAEKTLPNKRRTDWTVTLSKIVHRIRY